MQLVRFCLVALSVISGCGSEDEDALAANRNKWESSHPDSYVIRVCSTGFAAEACEETAVREGEVVAARARFFDEEWVERDLAEVAEPVAELFDVAASADCDHMDVEFDKTYGFVSNYRCTAGTEWSGETVECFAPNTTDLAACSSSQ